VRQGVFVRDYCPLIAPLRALVLDHAKPCTADIDIDSDIDCDIDIEGDSDSDNDSDNDRQ
jgi:hypothetical protein